jgi:hypothetical protein
MSMMKIFMLSTLSSLVAVSSAMASGISVDPAPAPTTGPAPIVVRGGGDHDHDRHVLRCVFAGPKGTECRAIVKLQGQGDAPASSNFDDQLDGNRGDRLFVSCGGTTVYNDGARVRDRDDLTIVSAIPAPPVLSFEKHDHDGEIEAWLDLGDDTRLPGRCEFLLQGDDDNGGGI